MSDIVEQAARKVFEHQIPLASDKPRDFDDPKFLYERNKAFDTAQALADAGLLAEPTRTVPTREEIAVIFHAGFDVRGEGICSSCTLAAENADAVLALMAGQPAVAEAKAQALEEAADAWQTGGWADAPRYPDQVQERIAHGQFVTEWLGQRAQQIRDGQHRPAVGLRPATPEMRVEWRPKPPLTKPDETHIEARATCRKCGTVTRVGMIARHGARPEFPQSLLKCDCQQIRDGK